MLKHDIFCSGLRQNQLSPFGISHWYRASHTPWINDGTRVSISELLIQGCFLAIGEKTQGEKNSRGEKLKEKTLKLKIKTQFSGILKEKINANFDNKCFFSSLFGRKEKKIQKSKKESKMAVQKLNRSQNLSKIFQKLKEKLKTQGKNSKIRHLITP